MFGATAEPTGKRVYLLPSRDFLDLHTEPHNTIMKGLREDEFFMGTEANAIKSFILARGVARWRIEEYRELIIEASVRYPLTPQQRHQICRYGRQMNSIQWNIIDSNGNFYSFKRGSKPSDFFIEYDRCLEKRARINKKKIIL